MECAHKMTTCSFVGRSRVGEHARKDDRMTCCGKSLQEHSGVGVRFAAWSA